MFNFRIIFTYKSLLKHTLFLQICKMSWQNYYFFNWHSRWKSGIDDEKLSMALVQFQNVLKRTI